MLALWEGNAAVVHAAQTHHTVLDAGLSRQNELTYRSKRISIKANTCIEN